MIYIRSMLGYLILVELSLMVYYKVERKYYMCQGGEWDARYTVDPINQSIRVSSQDGAGCPVAGAATVAQK